MYPAMFTQSGLPYSFSALEPYIDTATMEIHYGKHHAGYVKNLNEILPDKNEVELEKILRNLDTLPEDIRSKVRNNGGGHFNHSFFWKIMSPQKSQPNQNVLSAINTTFGSLDGFKEKFVGAAMGRFGSGWAWLVKSGQNLEIVDTPNQDLPGGTPLLCVDVWEHAYYLKYQNRRLEYLQAWWNVINWSGISI